MTKPTKWMCAQRILRSALASTQSDQSVLCAQRVAKLSSCGQSRLIKLGGCPGWSESSLDAHAILLVCHALAQFKIFDGIFWELGTKTSIENHQAFLLSFTGCITKTCLYNFDPLKPHFYIVKLGFTGVYIIFLVSAQNIDCGYSLEPPHRGGSNENPQSMFWAEIWKILDFFLSENLPVFWL